MYSFFDRKTVRRQIKVMPSRLSGLLAQVGKEKKIGLFGVNQVRKIIMRIMTKILIKVNNLLATK